MSPRDLSSRIFLDIRMRCLPLTGPLTGRGSVVAVRTRPFESGELDNGRRNRMIFKSVRDRSWYSVME